MRAEEDSLGPTAETVTLSQRAKEAIGLRTETATKGWLPLEIKALGTIEALPTRTYVQHALLGGRVLDTKVDLGDQVKKGQTLAILESPEINRMAADLLNTRNSLSSDINKARSDYTSERNQAEARLTVAQTTNDRLIKLYEEKIAALKSLEAGKAELEVAKNRLENLRRKEQVDLQALDLRLKISLRSQIDRLKQLGMPESSIQEMLKSNVAVTMVPVTATRSGVVTAVHANPGETINGQDPLFDILDYSLVWAQAEVYESDMDRVADGQRVIVTANALPHFKFPGKISHVGSEVDTKKHTLPVRVEVPNAELRLKPDMFVELTIATREPVMAMKVPRDAIIDRAGHYCLFIEKQPLTYQLVRVSLGKSLGDDIEIVDGVAQGQKVVVRGAFQLEANLLKAQGTTDVFSHPTDTGNRAHRHDEHEDEHNKSATINPLLYVAFALVFGLGVGFATIFVRTSKSIRVSTDESKTTSEEEQQKSRSV
ncbi:MAG: efflux RND transporter periplasmic adaptor subunit [Candidatus Obscuribacterales bacterium]|nr:efflux RND transporter periplasmic adaptor subunit [Candidatus Obscuribacterales bacterium]